VLLEKAIELPMQRGAMFVGDLVVLCAPADGASVGVNV